MVSFLDNNKVAAVSFSDHLNGRRHARKPRTDDENISSIRVAPIICGWIGIWVRHCGLRDAMKLKLSWRCCRVGIEAAEIFATKNELDI